MPDASFAIQSNIVFEDQDFLALNKPAGMVVNRSATTKQDTLQDHLGAYFAQQGYFSVEKYAFSDEYQELKFAESASLIEGDPNEIFHDRVGLAHRLDKETSGVVLVAKHPSALIAAMAAFKMRTVSKTYTALAHGAFAVSSDTIAAPIGRSSHNRHRFEVRPDGRSAITHYQVDKTWQLDREKWLELSTKRLGLSRIEAQKSSQLYDSFTLLSLQPKTGRTHQIRVHAAYLAHPLVGDEVYLGRKRARLDRLWCSRHFLHAQSLSFTHPRTGKELKIQAPLPEDLKSALAFVRTISTSQTKNP